MTENRFIPKYPQEMVDIRYTYKLLAALPMLMLTGCSADTADESPSVDARQPVNFSIAFGQATTRADVSTLDNIWPDESVVSISNGTNIYNYKTADNSSSLASGVRTSLSPVSDIFYWPVDDPHWSFTGWFPAGESPTISIEVSADQRSSAVDDAAYRAYDLLYCPPTAATFAGFSTVALEFHHMLSRVVVEVNTTLTNGEYVTNIAFGGGQIGLAGSYEPPTASGNGQAVWTISDGKGKTVSHMREQSSGSKLYTYECILPPQKSEGSIPGLVTITTGGSDEGERTYKYKKALELKAGYEYHYKLSISQQGVISLVTLQVIDWTSGGEVNNTATIPANNYPGVN